MDEPSLNQAVQPSSQSDEDCGAIQVITQDKEFNKKVAGYLKNRANFDDLGFDYHVASILGSQSTGKSTILNHMFGTKFDIMRDDERKQTTKGVWISFSKKGNVVIVDVEGTDGRERGEDKEFERKSSLFSLTISEVLIVNVWETQVGLHSGSNMSLLRTVFDVNLHLFGREGPRIKTCLLFAIRDYYGSTPMDNLVNNITGYLGEIWDDIVKPENCSNAKIEDFFDIEFVGVPHKIYAYNDFVSVVENLAKRFTDSSSNSYIFKKQYFRVVPADGFATYIEQIWNMIKINEDLDLPSQKQMLAKFRCDEVISTVIEDFNKKVEKIEKVHSSGNMVVELGSLMDRITAETHEQFDTKTFRYSKDVCSEKRKYLDTVLLGRFEKCYRTQMSAFISESSKRIVQSIEDLSSQESKVNEFAKKVKISVDYEMYLFDTICKDSRISGVDWDVGEERETLVKILDDARNAGIMSKIDSVIEAACNECLTEVESVFIEELDNRSTEIWHTVFRKFSERLKVARESLAKTLDSSFISSDQSKAAAGDFPFRVFTVLLSRIKSEIEDVRLVDRTVNLFINKLIYNEKGLTRSFYLKNDVDTAYLKAKATSESYARLLSKIEISKSELHNDITTHKDFNPKSLILIPSGRLAILLRHAGHICEGKFMDVKGRITNNRRGLPLWAIVALVFFGWNEVMAVLRSPLYLFIFFTAAVAAYLIWCFLYSDTLLAAFFRRFPQVMPKPIIRERSWTPEETHNINANEDHMDIIDKALHMQNN